MASENLQLWRRVSVTDPKAVKPITGKQYNGNSPKPYWIVERLTEEFGPCGIGWGFSILSERYERFDNAESLHIAVVRLWYELNGKRGELEQVGQTRGSYMTAGKDGKPGRFLVDEDAPKKSVTDALVKCASYLGFAGDIFSGRWDDSKYVAEANREWREREAAEAAANDPDRSAWLERQREAIFSATTVGELKRAHAEAVAFAASQNDSLAVDQLNAWADEKKSQAKPKGSGMSATLYQLAADFRAAAETLADLDLPPEVIADTLEGLSGDLELKAQNVALFVRNLEVTAAAIKQAEGDMAKRRKAIESRVASLKEYLLGAMQATGIKKIEGPYLRIGIRDNPEAVDVFDVTQLPAEFMRIPPPPSAEPDKAAIKSALKAGSDVPGARLTRSQRLDIGA